MTATSQHVTVLTHPEHPQRRVQVRVEGPPNYEQIGRDLPHVFVLHGFKGFMHWGFFPELSRRIAEAGMVAVSFNTSGSGVGDDLESLSEEEAFANSTFSNDLEDFDLVRAHVLDQLPCVDPERLGAFGHSRGGGMVLLHAERQGDYRAVVVWGSVDRVLLFDEPTVERWRADGQILVPNGRTGQVHRIGLDLLDDAQTNSAALDILAAAGRLNTPTLVVHGTGDEAVGFAAAEHIHGALAEGVGELLALQGAGHTFGAVHPFAGVTEDLEAALEGTLAHLQRHLDPGAAS